MDAWCRSFAEDASAWRAWDACREAWLAHLAVALGPGFAIVERDGDMLLSAIDSREADALLAFVARTRARIIRLLEGVARADDGHGATVIVFDDHDTYYRYVSRFYPEDGEFAFSGGMHITGGCPHFVTVRDALGLIEPVIAHELTHACVRHLPLPAWLNEGIAVNTERQLCGAAPSPHSPHEMHAKHVAFWDAESIQEFWSGSSFLRSDDGNLLSYDLARILVDGFAEDWHAFRGFANAADLADGGALAAHDHLGIELGLAVASLLGREDGEALAPNPQSWQAAPERGAFRDVRG